MSHKRVVCSCGAVIEQCRCPGPKETEVRQKSCQKCMSESDPPSEHCWCQNYNVAANVHSRMKMQEQCCWCGEWREMPEISTSLTATNESRKHGPHKRYFCGDPNHAAQATEIAALKGALERELCSRHRKGLEFARDCFSPAAGSVDQCLRLRRVLAGKEAKE